MKKVLKFYSETCGPCKLMGTRLKELKNAEISEINIDDDSSENLLDKYQIKSIPTIVVEDNNTVIKKFTGVVPIEDIQSVINK